MRREIWHETEDKLLRVDDAEPECGEDFCDTCGDCLHCYPWQCRDGDGAHRWISYGEPTPKEEP
jgi:hypothetical protein